MEVMNKEHIKYAGAGWLKIHLEDIGYDKKLSSLGVKVANVIGQVDGGIYHVYHDAGMKAKKVNWDGLFSVSVTWPGSLATYDFPQLTRLYLCCQAAGLAVDIRGSFNGYTKLMFSPSSGSMEQEFLKLVEPPWLSPDSTINDLIVRGMLKCDRLLEKIHNGEVWTVSHLYWHDVIKIVHLAHKAAYRVDVIGRNPQSLELTITKRSHDAPSIMKRHPTLDEAREIYKCWDVDYETID